MFLLAVILLSLFSLNHLHAQKITINTVDYKFTEQDTTALNRLVRFEAHLYNGLFNNIIPDSLPVVVNLYKSHKLFLQVCNARKGIMLPGGFYSPQTQECYVYKDGNYFSVILHEVSHRFMHYHNYITVPRWINEGLSAFCESLYVNDNGGVYVDEQTSRLRRVKDYFKENRLDISQFLSRETNDAWNRKDDITLRYDVAYSIVYFMIKNNPQYVKQVLTALQDHSDSYAALGLAYGSYENFDKKFRLFYR